MHRCRVTRAGSAVALAAALLAACGDGSSTSTAAPSVTRSASRTVPDTASDPGAQVARRIVRAASLADAVTATREAVTRGGLTITDFAGGREPAVGPASPFFVLPDEAVLLAHDARHRATLSRLTLADLGAMLSDFGWRFEGRGLPGDQMMAFVSEWVRQAQQDPDDPLSFTPLFLADMARRQVPAVDLADSLTSPHAVRLGFLEVQLIAAALTRGLGDSAAAGAAARAPRVPELGRRAGGLVTASYGARAPDNACQVTNDWFGSSFSGQAAQAGLQFGFGKGIDKGLEKAGLGDAGRANVGYTLDAIGAALQLVKLAQLYASGHIGVEPVTDLPAHRPAPDGEELVTVRASAGIDEDDWEEYRDAMNRAETSEAVKDCLASLGLPSWSDLGDIAESAEKWRVRWVLGRGSPRHAMHRIAGNDWLHVGSRQMRLQRTSRTTVEARYTFMLTEEWKDGHEGDQYDGEVEVTAELITAEPPTVGTFAGAAGGLSGVIKALIELGAGWFQTVVTPESTILVPVTYHDEGVTLLVEDEQDLGVDVCMGGPDCYDGGPTFMSASSTERSRHVYAGTIRLSDDSTWTGQVVLTSAGQYTQPDYARLEAVASGMEQGGTAGLNAMGETLALIQDTPTCAGSYQGYQILAVEGRYVRQRDRTMRLQLKFIPVSGPEEYSFTESCPWTNLDGTAEFEVVPNRMVDEYRGGVTIAPPEQGLPRTYREYTNQPGLRRSLIVTVGESF